MDPILAIKNISKKFRIQHEQQPYLSLRDNLIDYISNPFSKRISKEEFWALKDVSFNVYPGESIGVIGRNGAGKSTLLKILSKISAPDQGKIIVRGRMASLLEVGTGFHPELTGRENIYLNGSIYGMKRAEILKKFDEIVSFSGVEKFLDTPLKHFSTGMQLRLAFSVAAFLEPEILLIDEVLAVGDSIFQQKCIEKMTQLCQSGRTILFVSHNFSAVKALCKRAVLLNDGKLIMDGATDSVTDHYLSSHLLTGKTINLESIGRSKHQRELIFSSVSFSKETFEFGENIEFTIQLKSVTRGRKFRELDFGINIQDRSQNTLIHLCNRFVNKRMEHSDDAAMYHFSCESKLRPGSYVLSFFLRAEDIIQDWLLNTVELHIRDGNPYNYHNTAEIQGCFLPTFDIRIL